MGEFLPEYCRSAAPGAINFSSADMIAPGAVLLPI